MSDGLILLIEDDENDVFFFKRAAHSVSIPSPVHVLRDGRQAVDYFDAAHDVSNRERCPLPSLIVLDLNLPHRNGLDVLRHIRARAETRTIIVVVLTSSSSLQDIHEAYALGANSYLVKPTKPEQLAEHLNLVKAYWLTANRPPPPEGYRLFPH